MKPEATSPYQSRAAECSVLFHLASSNRQDTIFAELEADDFFHNDTRAMFERMQTAHNKGRKLKGDATVLAAIAPFVSEMGSHPGTFQQACESVVTMARRRQVAEFTAQANEMIADFSCTAADLEDKMRDIYESAKVANKGKSDGEITVREATERFLAELEQSARGNSPNLGTGLPYLDRLQRINPGELIVIGARPSVGKTAFAISMARGLLRRGVKCGFVCLEMTQNQITQRFLSQESGVPLIEMLEGHIQDMDGFLHGLEVWKGWEDILCLSMGSSDMTPQRCARMVRKWASEKQVQVVFLDYLQRFAPTNQRDEEVRRISKAVECFKNLAKDAGIAVVLLAQLNRDSDGKRPRLGHLKGSSTIEQEADAVILMFRPEKEYDDDMAEKLEYPQVRETGGRRVTVGEGKCALFGDKYRNGQDWVAVVDFHGPTMEFRKEIV